MTTTKDKPTLDKAFLLSLYKQGAKSQSELAEMFEVSKMTVNRIIKWELSPRERFEAVSLYKLKKSEAK